jgi:hypothetical protein
MIKMGNILSENTSNDDKFIKRISNSDELPILPDVFIEMEIEEPSINLLLDFINSYPNLYKQSGDEDLYNFINNYKPVDSTQSIKGTFLKNIETQYHSEKYYILGQVLIDRNCKITTELLKEAIDIDLEKSKVIGNSADYASMIRCRIQFDALIKLIELYYQYHPEIYLKPGGEGFLKAKKRWNSYF